MLKKATALAVVGTIVLAGSAAARAGDVDPTFGSGGVVATDIGGWDSVSDVLLQPDGRILIAGTIDWNGTRNPFLARYLPDGSLDAQFGAAGLIIPSRYTQPPPRIALQSDGKILLATRSDDAPFGLLVLRFEADGVPDQNFGTAGAGLIPSMFVASIAGIAVKAAGDIIVGARLSTFAGDVMGLARFASNGLADEGFGDGGLLTVSQPYTYIPLALTIDTNGRILMGGFGFGLPGRFFSDAFVARFHPDGVLDAGFGTEGIALIQQPDNATEIQALALQADGKIVAGGRAWGPAYFESRWMLARLGDAGAPDPLFGSGGAAEFDPSTGHDVILGIAINEAGIHVAGQTETLDRGLAAARFLSDGRLDAGFGPGGVAGVPGLAATGFNRIAVKPDGQVVVAGSGLVFTPAFAVDAYVARYSGESLPDTTPPALVLPSGVVADATAPTGGVVEFTATATDDFDPNPTVACTPPSGRAFPIGDTVVACLATDDAGNTSSESFSVHVRGAAEQLTELEHAVAGVGPARSLVEKVQQASALLGRNNAGAAVGVLRAFVSDVKAQAGKSIPPDQAAALVASATRIASVLGWRL